MTTTAREPGTYIASELPEVGDSASSRYALPVYESGRGCTEAEAVASAYATLNITAKRNALPIESPTATVALSLIAIVDGEYVIRSRGTITGTITTEKTRPGKFGTKNKLTAGALVDAVLRGEAPELRDDQTWNALRDLAENIRATGRGLRGLNDQVAIALAARAGLHVQPNDLPPVN